MAADILSGSTSSRRSWIGGSFRDPAEVFPGSSSGRRDDEEEDLKWAAIEKLPTMERMTKGLVFRKENGNSNHDDENGKLVSSEVDIRRLGTSERKLLMHQIFKVVEEDNERFLRRLRARVDRVGLELPTVEVRYQDLSVEGDAHIGSRALPTLLNYTRNALEGLLRSVGFFASKKKVNKILNSVSGVLKPSRLTLLLGPPASGKTTLLLSLAGKLEKELRVSGKISYCGHELSEFFPQRTCAYVSQHDLHNPEMTVRETIDFSVRCLGVGVRNEMLSELSRREKDLGIKPDPEIDAFMKATALEGQKKNLITDYILKVLGLDICADIPIGDEMRRGISGGQKKRVTTGEMLGGPATVLFMDEISTGLDSSTTFQIVKYIRQMVHVMDGTVIVSLLQPAPETFELFDDVILLAEGQIVYHGPRQNILEFFEFAGFRCPERKGVADFLQEVTSKKDQEQYWRKENEPYHYISVPEFLQLFKSFHIGKQLAQDLSTPYDKCKIRPAALATEKYGMSSWELLKACLSREWLLMRRNSFIYIFKATQLIIMAVISLTMFWRTQMHHETIADGGKYLGALFYGLVIMMFNGMAELTFTIQRLPVFYKQRDFHFFPPWAFGLSYCILKIPISLLESVVWVLLTYYTIGFAPAASRFSKQLLAFFFTHQMALSIFRFLAALGRTMVIVNTMGNFVFLIIFVLGGFIISKDSIQSWWAWGYWTSPMMYAQTAIAINEFLDPRWSTPNNDTNIKAPTVGRAILKSRGILEDAHWYWISVGLLVAFSLLFNACFVLAITFLNPISNSQAIMTEENTEDNSERNSVRSTKQMFKNISRSTSSRAPRNTDVDVLTKIERDGCEPAKRGMVLPFHPLSLVFDHVNYYIDMPAEMRSHGIQENRLQLLCDVSGAFRPGHLTALVGVSGAGKTTLMDVLAGRKTDGYTEGSISISGYSKKQETFARISGYCEQNDIHSPNVTVYESLIYSAWLRIDTEIDHATKKMFVDEVIALVELDSLRDALVGLPGVDGLSTEQRKRLTIAVELVANPSIIFMDEPTSGLDARAAAIVMRTVRNTVNTGRTVVCTIHQPSIDIFEAFDELLLMKKGGQVIYAGGLGYHSQKLIEYFEAFPGVPKFTIGQNPATWMLEISSSSVEAHLKLDFAELYCNSSLYQRNQDLIKELSIPSSGTKDLCFPAKYAQSFITQFVACFWKQYQSYWRNPQYNAMRFFVTLIFGLLFGTIFWKKAENINTQQDLFNLLGSFYTTMFFLAVNSCTTVQPVVGIERTVFYRERAAGMYSPLAYVLAQVSIEIIYTAIQSILYTILLFALIGYSWQADKFLWFLYFVFMSILYFTLFGMMATALTPNHLVAAVVSSFFFGLWNLFAGFLLPRPLMPIWWRWYFWANPLAWTLYGIIVSQLGDMEHLISVAGQSSMSVKDYLKDNLGYDRHLLGCAAGAHLGCVIIFTLVFAYSIRSLNFQKR